MTTFRSKRGHLAAAGGAIAIATLLAGVWSSPAIAQSREPPPTSPLAAEQAGKPPAELSREAWHTAMERVPQPKVPCFKASYPTLAWQEVPCTPRKKRPFSPRRPQTVGADALDFQAEVTAPIISAIGSFDQVAGVTSETGSQGANSYTLQLNTNIFKTAICDSSTNRDSCHGWQQFVFDGRSGDIFMQYWLINYGDTCPDTVNWGHDPDGPNCMTSSDGASVAPQPIGNLAELRLTATVTDDGRDQVTINTADEIISSFGDRVIFTLAQRGWQQAEFNVLGDGNSTEATFNRGSMMAVRLSVNYGSGEAPTCSKGTTTGETNNLNLVAPCCPYGGLVKREQQSWRDAPAIVFWQSNNHPEVTAVCANGTSIGDTHLTNFAGLLFDFQAAGDFLLAETGPDFIVHTRQVSNAPDAPDVSNNKAVALKMGRTRAALCLDPARLMVDGQRVQLRDGGGLDVQGGKIVRIRNTYVFTRPTGEEVRGTLHDGWIDVAVGVGRVVQSKVRGLLGNANGNTGENDLASRDRTVLNRPASFPDLYGRFGDSWRVTQAQSLPAQLCGRSAERGNPRRPFYAGDLSIDVAKKARAICTAAGVPEQLLDACTLDTAVTGKSEAARVFVGAKPPRAVLRAAP